MGRTSTIIVFNFIKLPNPLEENGLVYAAAIVYDTMTMTMSVTITIKLLMIIIALNSKL